jgi:hypothetical protein
MNADELHDDEAPPGSEIGTLREAYLAVIPRDRATVVAQRAIIAAKVVSIRANAWRRRRAAVAGLLSLAAAAAVVLVVAGRNRVVPMTPSVQLATPADSAASAIAVEVPEGKNAIVFATKNPLISVVWIY